MKTIYLLLLANLSLCFCACQKEAPRAFDSDKLRALEHALVPLRTIHSDDENFEDLQPLKTKWQAARVILLGEATHGDGATFAAKVRLVKFLHRELGFEVIAFESGFYDCAKAWSLAQTGVPVAQAARQSLFGIWSESKQVQPLFAYMEAMKASAHPLQLAGFDLQFSGKLSRDSLLVDLEKFRAQSRAATARDSSSWRIVSATLDTFMHYSSRFKKMKPQAQEDYYTASAKLCAALEPAAQTQDSVRTDYWLQFLRSTETLLRFMWNANFDKPDPKVFNLRDQQMGENLLWLTRARFADKKIIVWAATSHSTRHRQNMRSRSGGAIPDSGMIPMGDYVWRELREQSYVLGFVAHHGRSGARGRAPWDIAAPSYGSLEDWLAQTQHNYAVLDWRSLPQPAAWLGDSLLARPMGFVSMRARWPEIMDGVLFIREMTPSIAVE